jgi:hypothetical protein
LSLSFPEATDIFSSSDTDNVTAGTPGVKGVCFASGGRSGGGDACLAGIVLVLFSLIVWVLLRETLKRCRLDYYSNRFVFRLFY